MHAFCGRSFGMENLLSFLQFEGGDQVIRVGSSGGGRELSFLRGFNYFFL